MSALHDSEARGLAALAGCLLSLCPPGFRVGNGGRLPSPAVFVDPRTAHLPKVAPGSGPLRV